MPSLNPGDKVKIKYWNELPDEDDWNPEFFEDHAGKMVTIISILNSDTIEVQMEDGRKFIVDANSLKKEPIPDELFEM